MPSAFWRWQIRAACDRTAGCGNAVRSSGQRPISGLMPENSHFNSLEYSEREKGDGIVSRLAAYGFRVLIATAIVAILSGAADARQRHRVRDPGNSTSLAERITRHRPRQSSSTALVVQYSRRPIPMCAAILRH
jgi:hypothetical protein